MNAQNRLTTCAEVEIAAMDAGLSRETVVRISGRTHDQLFRAIGLKPDGEITRETEKLRLKIADESLHRAVYPRVIADKVNEIVGFEVPVVAVRFPYNNAADLVKSAEMLASEVRQAGLDIEAFHVGMWMTPDEARKWRNIRSSMARMKQPLHPAIIDAFNALEDAADLRFREEMLEPANARLKYVSSALFILVDAIDFLTMTEKERNEPKKK